MTHPNETVVRTFLEAALRDDMTAAGKMVADDIVWHFAGHSPISGEYAGRDGLSDFVAAYGRMLNESRAEESLDLHDVVANMTTSW
jgi:ketosteroid isomerase-like protein